MLDAEKEEKMIGYRTRLRENDDLSLAELSRELSRHFLYLRALILRKIMRSKDAQCNTKE